MLADGDDDDGDDGGSPELRAFAAVGAIDPAVALLQQHLRASAASPRGTSAPIAADPDAATVVASLAYGVLDVRGPAPLVPGLDGALAIGLNLRSLTHPSDWERFEPAVRASVMTELRMRLADVNGTYTWRSVAVRRVPAVSGYPGGTQTVLELTMRPLRGAPPAHLAMQTQTRDLALNCYEESERGGFTAVVDQHLHFTFVSPACFIHTLFSPYELLHRTADEIFLGMTPSALDEWRSEALAFAMPVQATVMLQRKDGDVLACKLVSERRMQSQASAIMFLQIFVRVFDPTVQASATPVAPPPPQQLHQASPSDIVDTPSSASSSLATFSDPADTPLVPPSEVLSWPTTETLSWPPPSDMGALDDYFGDDAMTQSDLQQLDMSASVQPTQISPAFPARRHTTISERDLVKGPAQRTRPASADSPRAPRRIRHPQEVAWPYASVHAGRMCKACGATTTPEWRRGPTGPGTLCNACGLKYVKHVRESRSMSPLVAKDEGMLLLEHAIRTQHAISIDEDTIGPVRSSPRAHHPHMRRLSMDQNDSSSAARAGAPFSWNLPQYQPVPPPLAMQALLSPRASRSPHGTAFAQGHTPQPLLSSTYDYGFPYQLQHQQPASQPQPQQEHLAQQQALYQQQQQQQAQYQQQAAPTIAMRRPPRPRQPAVAVEQHPPTARPAPPVSAPLRMHWIDTDHQRSHSENDLGLARVHASAAPAGPQMPAAFRPL